MRALLPIVGAMLLLGSLAAKQSSSPASTTNSHPQTATATSAQSPDAARQGFRIAGIVVSASTGQPLAAASVAIAPVAHGEERNISKSLVTGADGRFSFATLYRGKYSLMAEAHGFSLQAFERHEQYSSAI
ncbi:MAG TPA: carboxypeptidase-like regulatory domain-containing protein, partial [Candidatus Kryptonia bacterium]|nr:carboxypeptidase-like regulatory domain-containing protein [Candidatus Kryptonia bacterium]